MKFVYFYFYYSIFIQTYNPQKHEGFSEIYNADFDWYVIIRLYFTNMDAEFKVRTNFFIFLLTNHYITLK